MSARKAYLFASASHLFLGFYVHFYKDECIESPKEEQEYVSTKKNPRR